MKQLVRTKRLVVTGLVVATVCGLGQIPFLPFGNPTNWVALTANVILLTWLMSMLRRTNRRLHVEKMRPHPSLKMPRLTVADLRQMTQEYTAQGADLSDAYKDIQEITVMSNGDYHVRYLFDPLTAEGATLLPDYRCVHGHPLFDHCSVEQK